MGQPVSGKMMEYSQIAVISHNAFMQAVAKEMTKFERKEIEFRKKDREERAAALRIPLKELQH